MTGKPWTPKRHAAAAERKRRREEAAADARRPRKTIDYSAGGDPCHADRPLSVGQDPLLQRLQEGQR
jgi:hypothetical protein